ncbi:transcriptional regulator [Magnetococcales bacterium HHB-1]
MNISQYLKQANLRQRELAYRVGVTSSALSQIIHNKLVPGFSLVKRIEEATDWQVSRFDLRPDFFEGIPESILRELPLRFSESSCSSPVGD